MGQRKQNPSSLGSLTYLLMDIPVNCPQYVCYRIAFKNNLNQLDTSSPHL